jgi:6,7-dimethyl-8-ribityllumazine synthase
MTSSEQTALAADAVERFAERVGTSRHGRADGASARVAVVCAKFNGAITARLLEGVLGGLAACGVDARTVTVAWVPGAFEIPLAAQRVIASRPVDAVVALGAVIRGDTAHFDFVAGQCASGLQRVALDTGVPVVFGVLTTDTLAQALERCRDDESNKGYEAAITALEMVDLLGPVAPAED